MSNRAKTTTLLLIGCVIASGLTVCQSLSADAKPRKQSRPGNYLVPPPPAYMPSILPELKGGKAGTTVAQEPQKPQHPYKKYVFTAEGYDEPVPVQRKGVTYWAPSDHKKAK